MWQAETDNASRYASRVKMIVPTASAFFGLLMLGVSRLEFDVVKNLGLLIVLPGLCFGCSLVFLVRGFWVLLISRRLRVLEPSPDRTTGEQSENAAEMPGDSLTASYALAISDEVLHRAVTRRLDVVAVDVFASTYAAAIDLRIRNVSERYRVRAGEKWLIAGIVSVGLTITTYTSVLIGPGILGFDEGGPVGEQIDARGSTSTPIVDAGRNSTSEGVESEPIKAAEPDSAANDG